MRLPKIKSLPRRIFHRFRGYLLRWRTRRLYAVKADKRASSDDAASLLRSGFASAGKDCALRDTDCRAGKVVFVPHCLLNQNARVAGAAEMPAAATALISGLMAREIGIVQMPCPELDFFGMDRAQVPIGEVLASPVGRAACQQLAGKIAEQVRQYRSCGIRVLGILGKNGSPTCGVETTWDGGVVPGTGVFIDVLRTTLRQQALEIELAGIVESQPNEALCTIDRWLDGATTIVLEPKEITSGCD